MRQGTRSDGEILIVDDDPGVRGTLVTVFTAAGYKVTAFAEGASFLVHARQRTPDCVLMDVHLPGRSGLDILRALDAGSYPAPIFMISGQGDIPMAVEAIRSGALDFIEKPFRGSDVVARVQAAIEAWNARRARPQANHVPLALTGRDPLSPRENDVLAEIVGGSSNKETGRKLGISPRTVEVHRARLMEKLGAKNIADLMRIVMGDGRERS